MTPAAAISVKTVSNCSRRSSITRARRWGCCRAGPGTRSAQGSSRPLLSLMSRSATAKRCVSMSEVAGRRISARSASVSARRSISAQCGTSWPVSRSTMTVADSSVTEKPMSPSLGRLVRSGSIPGTCTRIGVEGLNPSFWFQAVGSSVVPSTLASSPVGQVDTTTGARRSGPRPCRRRSGTAAGSCGCRAPRTRGASASSAACSSSDCTSVRSTGSGAVPSAVEAAASSAGGFPLEMSPVNAGWLSSGAQARATMATTPIRTGKRSRAFTAFLCLAHS